MTSLLLPDANAIRAEIAWRAHEAKDIKLPRLQHWNYDPCREHADGWVDPETQELRDGPAPPVVCKKRLCGANFRRHQRVGISWLYFVKKGLLADVVGSGKTLHAIGLLALLREREELGYGSRALIVMRPSGLMQFQAELYRLSKHISIMSAMGQLKQRVERYVQPWEIGLIGYHMLMRDIERIRHFDISTLIVDDVDPLRNRGTQTAYVVKRMARDCDRVVVMTGTSLQKRLSDLHSTLETVGGRAVLGNDAEFTRRYVRVEPQTIYDPKAYRRRVINKIVGYKNIEEFKQKIAPLALRRTADDIDDIDMPTINPNNVPLELYPAQRAKYEELRRGVMKIITEQGAKVKHFAAIGKIHAGAKICAGLVALGEEDGPQTAVKLDWVTEKLGDGGDLEEEKVVIFINYKPTLRAMQARLQKLDIGFETVWGEERDKAVRWQSQERFWRDPKCRVLMGTTAIEQSLNLQVARHLINVDMILNPARMEQLAGRIRRDGSAYKHVYVHNLLCIDTQEDGYLPLLEREQALIDVVWDDNSELFEKLSPLALLQLITG